MSRIQETTNQAVAGNRADIQPLIADLGSNNGLVRVRTRATLVSMRGEAVPSLISALQDRNWHMRWEAAKALGEIGDPQAAPALVSALEDTRSGIRWLAAEGLIVIGREGLPPLLQTLIHQSDSEWLREGAHHIFRAWLRKKEQPELYSKADEEMDRRIQPVLKALDGIEPVIETPWAAQIALDSLNRANRKWVIASKRSAG